MRQSLGEWFTYNIIIIFIIIVFGLLTATLSYYKAFKVNSMILYSIDKFEGYNSLAQDEIERNLSAIGYAKDGGKTCPNRGDLQPIINTPANYYYCVYYVSDETVGKVKNNDKQAKYYNYSVVTYIYVDLPFIDLFKIPVYTKGERIYNFSDGQKEPNHDI